MFYSDFFNPDSGLYSYWRYRQRLAVILDGASLEEHFDNWQSILERRDQTGPREHAVQFLMFDSTVAFSLDVLQGREREHFYDDCMQPYDPYDFQFQSVPDNGLAFKRNFVFFQPKDGQHADTLFRFSIIQDHHRLRSIDNLVAPVISSFVRLLLAGKCDFHDITYHCRRGWESGRPASTLPFPNLPIEELLPRADSHEFIRIPFDESACSALTTHASAVQKLGLYGCRFWDNGKAVGELLGSTTTLTSFEFDSMSREGNVRLSKHIFSKVLKAGNFSVKSLTLHVSDMIDDPAICSLSSIPGIERLVVLGEMVTSIDKRWCDDFVGSSIKNNPTLKTLELGMEIPATELLDTLLSLVLSHIGSPLENIKVFQNGKAESREEYDPRVREIKAVLAHKSCCKELQQSSQRPKLVAHALFKAGKSSAKSRNSFVFNILRENVETFLTT